MSRIPIEAVSHKAPLPTALWPAVRALTLAGATLTTGLIAGGLYWLWTKKGRPRGIAGAEATE